jgi:hypothetical protein
MAAKSKCLAQMNKSRTTAKATKKRMAGLVCQMDEKR